jgi:hypothetical protein
MEIKFEDITVTFQLRYPRVPIMRAIDIRQLKSGKMTHLISLKIIQRVISINIKTPDPKITISFFT